MDLKFMRWLLRGSFMRRVILKAFMLILALIVVYLMQMTKEVRVVEPIILNVDKCPLDFGSNRDPKPAGFLSFASSFLSLHSRASHEESQRLTILVLKELMEKNLLQSNAKTLCVGDESIYIVLALQKLGSLDATSVEMHPYFSLFRKRFVYEIGFEDNHFDFVCLGDLDRVSVPSLLVMEVERVLRPGGTGVIIVGSRKFYIPVGSFLKGSDIVHTCETGLFTVVIFKKKIQNPTSFEQFKLPASCPSVTNNKPFIKYLEPLSDKISGWFEPELSYLPYHMNISSRNNLVFINIGAGEFAQASVAKMLKPYCSNHHKSFNVFVIDHNTSVLASYAMDPDINFIYDPALAGAAAQETRSHDYISEPFEEEEFEFVPWFHETVGDEDFVVLMMNGKLAELNIIVELFKKGAICRVDELFIRCSEDAECMKILKILRKSGFYVHLWSGE